MHRSRRGRYPPTTQRPRTLDASAPSRSYRAPGRVNLIGDHTDYNEGFALPIAIDLECVVRFTPRTDATIHVQWQAPDGNSDRYVRGVRQALLERDLPLVGMDAVVSSTIPIGAGLSSSAALEVAIALALCDASGVDLPAVDLALSCQRAEHIATGVPCGVMDQLASLAGRSRHALLLDCRSLTYRYIRLPDELGLIVIHSGLARTLSTTAYADRRASCERAAQRLGLHSLRDARASQVADEPIARHVVSENARTLATGEALGRKDFKSVGALLTASHASLRDDFKVSTPELDHLVEALITAGALGARLTGAGFGGCVVALAPRDNALRVAEAAARAYRGATGLEPSVYMCSAADGAGLVKSLTSLG